MPRRAASFDVDERLTEVPVALENLLAAVEAERKRIADNQGKPSRVSMANVKLFDEVLAALVAHDRRLADLERRMVERGM